MIFSPLTNMFRTKKFKLVIVKPDAGNLEIVKQMVENGKLKGQVSKVFNLDEVKEAHQMSQNGGFSGKLVIKI